MAGNTVAQVTRNTYDSGELDRPTTATSFDSRTVIKYIAPRTLGINHANSFQGSLRNFALANVGSNLNPTGPTATTTSHGLASLVHTPTFSTISPMQSIDGDRAIDEYRELSKLNQTLTDNVLLCCSLDAHNRAQELQLQWLERHANKNSATIEQMFRTEVDSAKQLIYDARRSRPDLEQKLNDIHQTTLGNDELYQQLLSKRNTVSKDLFNYQRLLAQNRAESEFLSARLQEFTDEIQFYTLKNNSLHARQVKLRYELDEETFAKQVLQMELEVLANEKITKEDIHASAVDDARASVDLAQIATLQPSNFYREQLNNESRRIRAEYEKKIEVLREEQHRRYELELHRFQMHKVRQVPLTNQEHEQKLTQNRREKKEIDQQIGAVRVTIHHLESEIEAMQRKISEEKRDERPSLSVQRHLAALEQLVHDRERQLTEAMRERATLKQQISQYREKILQYPPQTLRPFEQANETSAAPAEVTGEQPTVDQIKLPRDFAMPTVYRSNVTSAPPNEEPFLEGGTLTRFAEFNVEQDCDTLNKTFNAATVDDGAVIRLLCNRTVGQRLQIREAYRTRFSQNLKDVIEKEADDSLKKILKLLLLSPVEHDCYELRRVLTGISTDENVLIEIFLNRSTKQLRFINECYLKLYKNELQKDLVEDRDSFAIRLCLTLLRADRPDTDESDEAAESQDARLLHQTNARWRIDGSTFIDLIGRHSNEYLKRVFAAYQQFGQMDIEQAIKTETDTELSRGLMGIVRLIRNQPRFFAYELRKSLKGANTNEDNVNRILISRCEIDMVQIKAEYEKITRRTLFDHLQTDTSGNYKRALLELLRQRLEPSNRDAPVKQNPDSSDVTKQQNWTRPSTQLKESLSKQLSERMSRDRDVTATKKTVHFDRDNQGKSSTLLTLNSKEPRLSYIQQRTMPIRRRERLATLNDDDEEGEEEEEE